VWSTKDFESSKTLGEGGFGIVHLARLKGTQEYYALKQVRKSGYQRKNHRERAFSERDILAEQQSRWFVRLFVTFRDAEHVYMVMEFLQGGDLIGRLIKMGRFSEDETRFYMAELLEALDTVHSCGFVHRDVKPDNAVISSSGHLKLLDFGLCRQGLDPDEHFKVTAATATGRRRRQKSIVGTPQYLAPEAFKGDYGQEADLWSVGIITFECLVGRVPFDANGQSGPKAQQLIKQKVENHDQPCALRHEDGTTTTKQDGYFAAQLDKVRDRARLSPSAERFLKRMVCDVRKRLSAQAARREPFFMGVDFKTLHEQTLPCVPELSGPADTRYFDAFDHYELPKPKGDRLSDARLEWAGYDFDLAAVHTQREVQVACHQ
jgi:serine/threonine protein kinase